MLEFFLQLIRPQELFTIRPTPVGLRAVQMLAVFFGSFLIIAFIFLIFARIKKKDHLLRKAYTRFFTLFLTISLIGLLYSWFVYENAQILSARFIFIILMLTWLVWLGFILGFRIFKIPKIKKETTTKKDFEKYLP